VLAPTGWEDYDVRVPFTLATGDVVTCEHPVGCVQVRVRRRLRGARCIGLAAIVLVASTAGAVAGLLLAAYGVLLAAHDWHAARARPVAAVRSIVAADG
jgi:hypothetical protein